MFTECANIKFHVQLCKRFSQTHRDKATGWATVYILFGHFKDSKPSLKEDLQKGMPAVACKGEKIITNF